MKFGKRMRSLATAAWERDYVDYKQLKKTIRTLSEQLHAQGQDAEDATTPSAVFVVELEREMARVNAAHARIYSELYDRELRALRDALGNRWVLSAAQARSLLIGAIELSEKVDAFRRFNLLNSLAIVKITKKFDKTFPQHELRHVVMEEMLKTQPFYDGATMDKLCTATGQLTDRVMLCVLPDGNFRISDHKVSCPICLHGEVKSAITLSCKHTFCWTCLSKAAEHRFHSCPLCRKEQSIDPRDYAVDGLLMRFKRAYAFVEDALDRAPFAASRMRQILVEGFDVVNTHLGEIEAKYAALSPRPSLVVAGAGERRFSQPDCEPKQDYKLTSVSTASSTECSVRVTVFTKGDAVEVHYNGEWYPGMVLHENDVDATSYSVIWWMQDQSQRFGQRMPRHLLRDPVFPEKHPSQYMLLDVAADAWKTATEWALAPLRRLRSMSQLSETSSVQGNSTAA